MSTNGQVLIRPDTRLYAENRAKVPPESMLLYAGQCVAWTPDGMRMVGHAADFRSLWAQLQAQQMNPSEFVIEDVPLEE